MRQFSFLFWLCLAIFMFTPIRALAVDIGPNIRNTPHNLSVSGPGEIRAESETRMCVFCHTPHNAAPKTPLWNKQITEGTNYILYSSDTMVAQMRQPTGPTRLCLSCHDGTIALGNVMSVPGGIAMTRELFNPSHAKFTDYDAVNPEALKMQRHSYIGTDISNDHPVSFSYRESLPNPELIAFESFTFPIIDDRDDGRDMHISPGALRFYNGDVIHCSTCHDPHDNRHGKFLVMDNVGSSLCVRCHQPEGWSMSAHSTSEETWSGRGKNPWPRTSWLTVRENGCGNCHAVHGAQGKKQLLRKSNHSDNCTYACHNGRVGTGDVTVDMYKMSRHPVNGDPTSLDAHAASELPTSIRNHVECVDCHNPHAAFGSSRPPAPFVSGPTALVSGVSQDRSGKDAADYEYEICFKCHGDLTTSSPFISRWVDESNTRLEFNPLNPSYHPVVATGRNFSMPSLPSSYDPTLSASSRIFCTDCHDSNDSPVIGGVGIRGPHGSDYKPILRQRYETADGTIETQSAYELCYYCHDRQKILADMSFRRNSRGRGGHSYHLTGHGTGFGAPCSVCHDPHGVYEEVHSGDHTHLINFDRVLVRPVPGKDFPYFNDKATGGRTGAGSCVLVCHQFTHTDTNSTYGEFQGP